VKFPNNSCGIIDANYSSDEGRLLPTLSLLQYFHPKELAFICLTHPHADHYLGFPPILEFIRENNVSVLNFTDCYLYTHWLPQIQELMDTCDYNSRELSSNLDVLMDFYKLLQERKKKRKKPRIKYNPADGYMKKLFSVDDTEVFSLAPSPEDFVDYMKAFTSRSKTRSYFDENLPHNRISAILKMTFGDMAVIFGGDAEEKAWTRIIVEDLNQRTDLCCDVLKVSHHGSKTNLLRDNKLFLHVKKERTYSVISSNYNNLHRPHLEVLEAIREAGLVPFCTNLSAYCNDKPVIDSGISIYEKDVSLVSDLIYQDPKCCNGNILFKLSKSRVEQIVVENRRTCDFLSVSAHEDLPIDQNLWNVILK